MIVPRAKIAESGAAIALLDSVYLPLHIPGVTFKTVVFGLPRVCAIFSYVTLIYNSSLKVGNQAFANYVDAHVKNLNHINNKEDFIPVRDYVKLMCAG